MATVAIEVVDAGLVPARDGTVATASPGVALLDQAGVVVGHEAAAQLRLKPVQAFDRFWSDLTTDPLPRPVPAARSRADLAHAHLARLWSEVATGGDEALFVVPATLRAAELGLLAGIADAAGVPVAGYVDLAVAACAPLEAHASVLHLDLQLHQAVLTELGGEDLLRRQRLEVAPRVGLRALQSAWAQLVAESMVRRTRFDPLHQAASEQQLYDRLPGWLAAAAGAEAVEVEVEASAGTFGVSLRREQFAFAAEAYYTQLVELVQAARRAGEPVTVVLSRHGWARAAKGHEIDPTQLSYKAGDGYLAAARCRSNQTAVFVDSTGRAYSMPAHSLPSARGQGEPLSGRFNPPDGASFGGVLAGQPEDRWLLATSAGYGFITRLSDLFSRNRAGKVVLRVPDGAGVLVPAPVPEGEDALVVAVTDTGRLLCFPAEDLPMLARGKGNKIINVPLKRVQAREEFVVAIACLPTGGRLIAVSGKRHIALKASDLEHYQGERGRRGNKLPRGFQRVDTVRIEH